MAASFLITKYYSLLGSGPFHSSKAQCYGVEDAIRRLGKRKRDGDRVRERRKDREKVEEDNWRDEEFGHSWCNGAPRLSGPPSALLA